MKFWTCTLLAIAGLTALAVSPSLAQQGAADADIARGKSKYLAVGCFTCHGRAGQGGALNYPAPALVGLPMPAEALATFLRNPPGDMPPYAQAVLNDADVADILAFISSLPGRKDPKTIPLLNP